MAQIPVHPEGSAPQVMLQFYEGGSHLGSLIACNGVPIPSLNQCVLWENRRYTINNVVHVYQPGIVAVQLYVTAGWRTMGESVLRNFDEFREARIARDAQESNIRQTATYSITPEGDNLVVKVRGLRGSLEHLNQNYSLAPAIAGSGWRCECRTATVTIDSKEGKHRLSVRGNDVSSHNFQLVEAK